MAFKQVVIFDTLTAKENASAVNVAEDMRGLMIDYKVKYVPAPESARDASVYWLIQLLPLAIRNHVHHVPMELEAKVNPTPKSIRKLASLILYDTVSGQRRSPQGSYETAKKVW